VIQQSFTGLSSQCQLSAVIRSSSTKAIHNRLTKR
jgi:hypothetical protein